MVVGLVSLEAKEAQWKELRLVGPVLRLRLLWRVRRWMARRGLVRDRYSSGMVLMLTQLSQLVSSSLCLRCKRRGGLIDMGCFPLFVITTKGGIRASN